MTSSARSREATRSASGAKRGRVGTQEDVLVPRIEAFVLDYVLSGILAAVAGIALAFATGSQLLFYLGFVVVYLGYFVSLEGKYGQTVGKREAGIVVVDRYGGRISYEQAAVRNALRIVDGLFNYVVGLFVLLFDDDKQRIGDKAADTLVVRAR